jgi:hypothetical protein
MASLPTALFRRDGTRIEKADFLQKIDHSGPRDRGGKAFRIDDAAGRYVVFLKSTFPKDLDLAGMKIVLDCANGAGYKIAPAVLEELGAEVVPVGVKPNGTNINAGCGSPSGGHQQAVKDRVTSALRWTVMPTGSYSWTSSNGGWRPNHGHLRHRYDETEKLARTPWWLP